MTRTVTTTKGGSIVSDISNLSIPFFFILAQKNLETNINTKPAKNLQNKEKKSKKKSTKTKTNLRK